MSHYYIITLGVDDLSMTRSSGVEFAPGESRLDLFRRVQKESEACWRSAFDLAPDDMPLIMFWHFGENVVEIPGEIEEQKPQLTVVRSIE